MSEERRLRDREIYDSSEWTALRYEARRQMLWYEGKPLREKLKRRDQATGRELEKFPLHVNLVRLVKDVVAESARGIPDRYDLIVTASVDRACSLGEHAVYFEDLVNNLVMKPSHGASVVSGMLRSMSVFGGAVLRLHYEPWNTDLPLRLAVRLIRDPSRVYIIPDPDDEWRPLEAYYGFEMDAKAAVRKYGIVVDDEMTDKVLYLEHWTRDSYEVSVHGQVPKMEWNGEVWKLSGYNPFGIVPFYYAPAKRVSGFYSDGETGIERLQAAYNIALAHRVNGSKTYPGVFVGTDLQGINIIPLVFPDGTQVGYVLDAGRTRPTAGANAPSLKPVEAPDIPDGLMELPDSIMEAVYLIARTPKSVFGNDDTGSGRITGPAIANRTMSGIMNATTLRINAATVLSLVYKDIIRVSVEYLRDALQALDVNADIPDADISDVRVTTSWPSIVPTDRLAERQQSLNERMADAISPQEFLTRLGISDVDAEMERIYEHAKRMADIDAEAKAKLQKDTIANDTSKNTSTAN